MNLYQEPSRAIIWYFSPSLTVPILAALVVAPERTGAFLMPAWAMMVISVPSGGLAVTSRVISLWSMITLFLHARTFTFSLPAFVRLGTVVVQFLPPSVENSTVKPVPLVRVTFTLWARPS